LGHYLSALSLQYRATGDSRFKERVNYIVSELANCQQQNGFLSAQANLAEPFATLAAGHGDALLKFRVPWYIQHKMFAGLRDACCLTGNQQARDVLIRPGQLGSGGYFKPESGPNSRSCSSKSTVACRRCSWMFMF